MSVAHAQGSTSVEDEKALSEESENVPDVVSAQRPNDEAAVASLPDGELPLPKNNIPLVFFSLLLATFLVRLESTW